MNTLSNIAFTVDSSETNWKELIRAVEQYDLPEVFQDTSRLKIFFDNFMEYYKEYDSLKSCSPDEYSAILYYLIKRQDNKVTPPVGQELILVVRIISRLKEIQSK